MDPRSVADFILPIMVIVGVVLAMVGGLSYLWPRTPVGHANERYTDALEGENEVNRRTIARLETDATDLRRELERALLRVGTLETDIATAKAENDRLRAENTRLHDRLVEHGLDATK